MVNLKNPDISVAPMMDWTDRHCRYFLRLISPQIRLYTEMVTTGAMIHGDLDRHLSYHPAEHPLALQLGGSDPAALAQCAKIGEDYGYNEINLNCGCPSDRVQNGSFGACLMKTPSTVAECVSAMANAVKIPVTVKCRIGVDECEEIPFLMNFIQEVKSAGCKTFIIHARKAWLKGLSPKENREIPPLRYDIAALVKKEHPDLTVIVNGGITTGDQVAEMLKDFDGVMIGREAYHNPYSLADLGARFYDHSAPSREDIAMAMIPYMEQQGRDHGTPVKSITRHILGLYQGRRGGRAWRRVLSTESFKPGVEAASLIAAALNAVTRSQNAPEKTPENSQDAA